MPFPPRVGLLSLRCASLEHRAIRCFALHHLPPLEEAPAKLREGECVTLGRSSLFLQETRCVRCRESCYLGNRLSSDSGECFPRWQALNPVPRLGSSHFCIGSKPRM